MSAGGDDEPHEEHEEHVNHEAWVIPYADLLTLLMAMFIALFAMSNVDKDKFKELALGLNQAFSGNDLNTGVFADPSASGVSPFNGSGGSSGSGSTGGQVGPSDGSQSATKLAQLLEANEQRAATHDEERELLKDVEDQLRKKAIEIGVGNNVELELQERGLVVRIVTDKVLFGSGAATLTAEGIELVNVVGAIIRGVDNQIIVEGHTDDIPISNEFFPSNMHLSSARAATVVVALADLGLESSQLRSQGYGDQRPIVPNDSDENRARNRRVEIVVQSKLVEAADNRTPVPDETNGATGNPTPGIDDIVGDLGDI